MKIAELFVNIGIKGTDKAVSGVQSVNSRLGDVTSKGLAAKAALFGVMYGLQRMMSSSTSAGLSLKQFSDYTGMSADKLQRWQYLFRLAKVGPEEVASSLQNLQNTMVKFSITGQAPAGLEQIAQVVGGIDLKKIEDATYMMEKFREYAKKETRVGLANVNLQSMGLSPSMIAAMRTSTVDLDKISNEHIYSDKQVGALAKAAEQWEKLFDKIEKKTGKFMAQHGASLMKGTESIVNAAFKIGDAFLYVAEKLELFKGIEMLADLLTSAVKFTGKLFGKEGDKKQNQSVMEVEMFFQDMINSIKAIGIEYNPAVPKPPKVEPREKKKDVSSNFNIKQEFIFNGDVKEPSQVAGFIRDKVEETVRTSYFAAGGMVS